MSCGKLSKTCSYRFLFLPLSPSSCSQIPGLSETRIPQSSSCRRTCLSPFAHCWDKIPKAHNLKEEIFTVAHINTTFSPCRSVAWWKGLSGQGKSAHLMADRKQSRKGGRRKEIDPYQVMLQQPPLPTMPTPNITVSAIVPPSNTQPLSA